MEKSVRDRISEIIIKRFVDSSAREMSEAILNIILQELPKERFRSKGFDAVLGDPYSTGKIDGWNDYGNEIRLLLGGEK